MRTLLKKRREMMRQKIRQAGLTLAETLMVIAVGAVAIVSGTLLFMNAMDGTRIQDAVNGLQALRTEVSSLYGTAVSVGTGDITETILRGGQVPANMNAGDSITHFWDGEVTIEGAGPNFNVTFEGLPDSVCVQMFSRTASEGGGLIRIGINGTTQEAPFDPAFAATNCDGGDNDVVWTFRK